jgi:dephospho-CoA kinase
MIRVGLTGGIGSGKSTAARVLELLGVPVYCADAHGRWLSDHDPEVAAKIRSIFGPQAYIAENQMDRKYIAGKVFGDTALLAQLNAAVHPAVRDDYRRWLGEHAGAPYTVMESAILLEGGFDREMDRIVAVTAPEALRVARTMRRDGTDEASVRARIAAQMSDGERIARADHVLRADDRELLIPQILAMHEELLSQGK